MDSSKQNGDASADQWTAAVERYRETAKWAIAAFAAIGALLAGTAPLAGIGAVSAERIWAVILGAILGLTGVGAAITATVATLVPRTVYPHEVRAEKQSFWARHFRGLGPLENILFHHPESVLPPGVRTWQDLLNGISNLRRRVEAADRATRTGSAAEKKEAKAAYDRYAAELEGYEENRYEVLLMARFEKARTGFRAAFVFMLTGSLLAGGGLAFLLYGVTDSEKARAETGKIRAEAEKLQAEAAKTRSETGLASEDTSSGDVTAARLPQVTVRLTEHGKRELGDQLGPACDPEAIPAVVLQGDSATGVWIVATLPGECEALRLTLDPETGGFAPA